MCLPFHEIASPPLLEIEPHLWMAIKLYGLVTCDKHLDLFRFVRIVFVCHCGNIFLFTSLTIYFNKSEKLIFHRMVFYIQHFWCGGGKATASVHYVHMVVYTAENRKLLFLVRFQPKELFYIEFDIRTREKNENANNRRRRRERKKGSKKATAIHDWMLCRAHNNHVDQRFSSTSIYDRKKQRHTVGTYGCPILAHVLHTS